MLQIGSPKLSLVTVLVSVVASVAASLLAFEYRLRRKRSLAESDEIDEWMSKSQALVGTSRRKVDNLPIKEARMLREGEPYKHELDVVDHARVREVGDRLSKRITEHVETAPDTIDEELIDEFNDLANKWERITTLSPRITQYDMDSSTPIQKLRMKTQFVRKAVEDKSK